MTPPDTAAPSAAPDAVAAAASRRGSFISPVTAIALGAAVLWWTSSFAFLVGRLPGAADDIPLTDVVGAFGMAVVPGLVFVLAGLMGGSVLRSRKAEAILVAASDSLLAPVRTAGGEMHSVGQAVAEQSSRMRDALAAARKSTKGVASDIENSCTALTATVGEASTISARHLDSLHRENDRLVAIAATIAESAAAISGAIAGHHSAITGALGDTRAMVDKADAALRDRTRLLGEARDAMSGTIGDLGETAARADRAADALSAVLKRMDDKIEAAAAQMTASMQAGSAMEEASRGAVRVLDETTRTAIADARAACTELSGTSAAATQDVAGVLRLLKDAETEAETKAKDVARAARIESSTAEARIRELGNNLFETAAEATRIAESGLDKARSRIEKASRLLGGQPDPAEPVHQEPPPAQPVQKDAPPPTIVRQSGTGAGGKIARPVAVVSRPGSAAKEPTRPSRSARAPRADRRIQDGTGGEDDTSMSWKDILSSIDRDPQTVSDEAAEVVKRFGEAGIGLRRAVTTPDLRRIAEAAQWGEHQRRLAVRKAAPAHIEKVTELFARQPEFAAIAGNFVGDEDATAASRLKSPGGGSTDAEADARLIAYLIADTALGVGGADRKRSVPGTSSGGSKSGSR